jgi:RNA polymerase sigma-70 factor (ECF subfamily)
MANSTRVEEFVGLFTSHEVRLRAFAMSLVANHADAEDVLQQANLVLWKKFDQFRSGSDFMAWAGRIVYLEAHEARKRRKRRELFDPRFYEAVARQATDPKVSEDLVEREKALYECVAGLSTGNRELLKLRYDAGASIESIAEKLGRSADAIYTALSRIRKVLFECVLRRTGMEGAR